jgi:starch synthase
MPSEYEPCGLNLMYSMNYGSVPIVRATGGLKQVAQQYDTETKEGNAFVFENYEPKEFLEKIIEAMELFKNSEEWETIMNNGMEKDFSWNESADKYVNIYKELLK